MSSAGDNSGIDLCASLDNLTFDKMSLNTNLAKEYVRNFTFLGPTNHTEGEKPVKDDYGNFIYFCKPPPASNKSISYNISDKNREIAYKIAENLSKNSNLISQLDNLIRGTSLSDLNNSDIPLLIDYFKNIKYKNNLDYNVDLKNFILKNDDPIFKLGKLANHIFYGNFPMRVTAENNTAVICHLFCKIFFESGLLEDQIVFDVIENTKTNDRKDDGCVAIVTEKSDLDAVITCLMNSTQDSKYPWKLKRVIVQENIYEKFKSKLKSSDETPQEYEDIQNKAMDIKIYNGRVLVFDLLDNTLEVDWWKPIILIEAYRTTKELISLLQKYPSKYISLWCNEISVANEISFKCDAELIWINNIGDFKGSQLLSSIPYNICEMIKTKPACQQWMKYDLEKRKDLILNCIQKYDVEVIEYVRNWKPQCFFEVNNGRMVVGAIKPVGASSLSIALIPKLYMEIEKNIINSLLLGNTVVTDDGGTIPVEDLKKTVPIVVGEADQTLKLTHIYKVVVSRFNETYAN